MRQHRMIRLAAPLLVGSLVLAACGNQKSEKGGGGDTGGKIVKIGVIAPLSGELSSLGLGIRNAVDLAIRQANEKKTVKGWTIKLAAEDDTAKPDVGAQVATKLTSDPEVAGVVGTLNSSVAQAVQPILDKANILMVSPANTNPTLTQGDDPNNKRRTFQSYFRTATTDAIQGPFAAQYVAKTVGLKNVAVVHDKKTYGQGLTDAFKAEFTKNGGTVLTTETINPGDKDFSAVISKIKPLAPQLVYYGGEFPEASLLSNQMKAKGLNVPLMGGDGIFDSKYIENGTPAATEGDLSTSVGAPTEKLASAQAFVSAYSAAGFKEPYAAYGAYAFDAANAIINALAQVLPGKKTIDASTRQAIVKAEGSVAFDGVTGKVAFDQYGDTTSKILTIYKVTGGKWDPVKTDEFK